LAVSGIALAGLLAVTDQVTSGIAAARGPQLGSGEVVGRGGVVSEPRTEPAFHGIDVGSDLVGVVAAGTRQRVTGPEDQAPVSCRLTAGRSLAASMPRCS